MACRHECHGPGGLMQFNPAFGDDIYHNHPAGMWMFNYKYMHMAMYGINDKITVMGMLNYLETDMDMLMDMSPFNMDGSPKGMDMGAMPDDPMKTSGLGDTELRGICRLTDTFNTSLGLSLPTGDIEQEYTAMGTVWRAP